MRFKQRKKQNTKTFTVTTVKLLVILFIIPSTFYIFLIVLFTACAFTMVVLKPARNICIYMHIFMYLYVDVCTPNVATLRDY